MAKYTTTLTGDFDRWLDKIESGILNAHISASLESRWRVAENGARCAVLVFERYSFSGQNRLSLNVTLFESGSGIHLCAVTSGGSQAMFFKINTFGEENFLNTLKRVIQ